MWVNGLITDEIRMLFEVRIPSLFHVYTDTRREHGLLLFFVRICND